MSFGGLAAKKMFIIDNKVFNKNGTAKIIIRLIS